MADWDTQILYTNNQWYADGSTSIPIDAGNANTIKSVDWSNQELHTPVYNTGKSLCWRDCTMYGFAPSGLTLDWANCELVVAGVPTIGWDACQLTDRAGDLSHDWEKRKLYDDSAIASVNYGVRLLNGVWVIDGDGTGTNTALILSGGMNFTGTLSGVDSTKKVKILNSDSCIEVTQDYYGYPVTTKIGESSSDFLYDTEIATRAAGVFVGMDDYPAFITVSDGVGWRVGYTGTIDTSDTLSLEFVAGILVAVT
jgi:hypothetical protein